MRRPGCFGGIGHVKGHRIAMKCACELRWLSDNTLRFRLRLNMIITTQPLCLTSGSRTRRAASFRIHLARSPNALYCHCSSPKLLSSYSTTRKRRAPNGINPRTPCDHAQPMSRQAVELTMSTNLMLHLGYQSIINNIYCHPMYAGPVAIVFSLLATTVNSDLARLRGAPAH